jgi:hypothetical protein
MFLGFWAYTRWVSIIPAQQFIHALGRDNLGNLTITTEATKTNATVDSLSNQLIAERLTNIEQLCTRSIRLSIYDQPQIQPIYPQTPTTVMPSTATNLTTNPSTTGTVRVIENNILYTTSWSRL